MGLLSREKGIMMIILQFFPFLELTKTSLFFSAVFSFSIVYRNNAPINDKLYEFIPNMRTLLNNMLLS